MDVGRAAWERVRITLGVIAEAEKAADINILEVRAVGSFGRVYIGGEERDVVVAHEAATQAIKAVTGKTKK